MDILTAFECPRMPWPRNGEIAASLQMHFDAGKWGIEESDVLPVCRIKIAANQMVDVEQHIEVKRGGDAQRIVVGWLQNVNLLDQIHSNQQTAARRA